MSKTLKVCSVTAKWMQSCARGTDWLRTRSQIGRVVEVWVGRSRYFQFPQMFFCSKYHQDVCRKGGCPRISKFPHRPNEWTRSYASQVGWVSGWMGGIGSGSQYNTLQSLGTSHNLAHIQNSLSWGKGVWGLTNKLSKLLIRIMYNFKV